MYHVISLVDKNIQPNTQYCTRGSDPMRRVASVCSSLYIYQITRLFTVQKRQ